MKPNFKIGFELECAVRGDFKEKFESEVRNMAPSINIGYDGSIESELTYPPSLCKIFDFSETRYYPEDSQTEIRTPPLPLDDGVPLFFDILKVMRKYSSGLYPRLETNESTGVHVNISELWLSQDHTRFCKFYAHLLHSFPEEKVVATFDREDNDFCAPVCAYVNEHTTPDAIFRAMEPESVSTGEYCDKYQALTIHSHGLSVSERRVEFRCLGNEDYHYKKTALRKTINTIIACAQDSFIAIAKKEQGITVRASERIAISPGQRFAFRVPIPA